MIMKPEHIRTIGSTIFWTFLIVSFIHVVFLSALDPESVFNQTMRAVLGCFCLFGISLEIAADRIQKKYAEP